MIAEDLTGFAVRLRAAGMVVELPRLSAAAAALAVPTWDTPYWPLRLTLCGRPADIAVFDAVYRSWFAGPADEPEPFGYAVAIPGPAELGDPRPAGAAEPGDGEAGADHLADLATRDFGRLSETDRALVAELITRLAPGARLRRAPRWKPARSGRVDIARTARRTIRNGGEPTRLLRRQPTRRPRRLLFLIDISGSMKMYADPLLMFAYAAVRAGPRTTEVFTIGTRWTRVTAELLAGDAQTPMRALAALPADWQQGTQLGRSIQSFLRRWAGHCAVRSAVVVIASDGMDEDADPTLLPRQIARLSRLAHRIIWVNPARRRRGYRPVYPGLEESLQYADEQLTGHTLTELRALAEAIAR